MPDIFDYAREDAENMLEELNGRIKDLRDEQEFHRIESERLEAEISELVSERDELASSLDF